MTKAEKQSKIDFLKALIRPAELRVEMIQGTLQGITASFDEVNSGASLVGMDLKAYDSAINDLADAEENLRKLYQQLTEIEAIVPEDDPVNIIIETKNPIISVQGVDFGDIIIGRASTLPITIRNTGDDELKITGYVGLKNTILKEIFIII